jgi:glycine hydroxymethyltransferase
VDLRAIDVSGKVAENVLDSVGITGNKNTIPFDPQPPSVCSGIRLGTPALTTRGMGEDEMKIISTLIVKAIAARDSENELNAIRNEVESLSKKFPLYKHRLVA